MAVSVGSVTMTVDVRPASEVRDLARSEVRAAVEEWFTDVDLSDLFATKGWQ